MSNSTPLGGLFGCTADHSQPFTICRRRLMKRRLASRSSW
jgi:hypothetical protein